MPRFKTGQSNDRLLTVTPFEGDLELPASAD